MTDREMLLLSYGAIKALSAKGNGYSGNLESIVGLIEDHLYPTPEPVDEIGMDKHFEQEL
jgi:hypothetical protein